MNERPLQIAMFTNNYYPFIGGVPISIERLIKGLRALGHTVVLFAPQYPGQEPDDDPGIIRCKLLSYRQTEVFNFAVTNIFSQRIEREFRRRRFDIIHVHHPFWMGTLGMNLARKHNIPVVLTYHTRFDRYSHYVPVFKSFFKSYISHSIVKFFSQRCDAVFAPTRTALDYLREIGVTKPIEIMPTGVEIYEDVNEDELRAKLAPNGEALLCTVSRLAREKNIDFLIDGIKLLKDTIPLKLVLIGEGPERGDIENMLREACMEDTVIMAGSISPDEVARYYRASDLFVFASLSETQGMVLLEAMAGGCPVVAVSAGGVDDVVIDGFNGYKTSEDAGEWAERVAGLLNCRAELEELSRNASAYARRFSLEAMASQAVHTYKKAINARG